ncbi:MAG: hypothetical protein QGI33_05005, partial [Candidatus Brocadiia bacterium]|nr:hypothetical protein [Candidatus Brocadiia bacterium]
MKTLAYLVLALGALGCGAGVACGAGAARSQKRWAGAVGLASVHAPIGNRLLSFEGYSTAAAALLTWPPGLPIAAGGLLVLGSAFGAFLFVLRRRKADGTGGRSGALAAGPPA